MKKLSMAALLGLAAFSTSALAVVDTPVELDTLILYSQGSADMYDGDVETRINHLVETTNKIYKDSGLNVRINPVKIQQYKMDDSSTSGTILGKIRKDTNVATIRDAVGADNVVMYRPYAHDGACGLGYQNNYLSNPDATWVEKYMFAHVSINCTSSVTAHEVGHNSGLGHSAAQGSKGAYEYARGHGVQDTFVTVMAYRSAYNAKRINKFSSPALDCNGLPCGIEEGEENEADAVKALKQTLPLIEKFRVHVENNDTNIDNNDTTVDNNTTTNDNQKFLDALKAYENQKIKVQTLKEQLANLKTVISDKKQVYIDLRTEYKNQRASYNKKKIEYKRVKANYREVLKRYREARIDYKAKRITKEQYLSVRAELSASRETYKSYRTNTLKPAYIVVKDYYNHTLKPAYAEYKKAVVDYRNSYKNSYRPAVKELRVLKKKYLKLKKVYG